MPPQQTYGGNIGVGHQQLTGAFNAMSDTEQFFCNDIMNLYFLSRPRNNNVANKTGKDGMSFLGPNTIQNYGDHVFCGAHVVVEDYGQRYRYWCQLIDDGRLTGAPRESFPHGSSHYGGAPGQREIHLPGQLGIDIDVNHVTNSLGCILFGRTDGGHTFFQNESWAAARRTYDGAIRTVAHGALGFLPHFFSGGMQVGALGYSNHSEKNGTEVMVSNAGDPAYE